MTKIAILWSTVCRGEGSEAYEGQSKSQIPAINIIISFKPTVQTNCWISLLLLFHNKILRLWQRYKLRYEVQQQYPENKHVNLAFQSQFILALLNLKYKCIGSE